MRFIVTDIETVPHDCATEFVPSPDLSQIAAAKNLKDPVKIEADIAQRKADALTEHAEKLSRAALDWNLSRIVAIGWFDGHDTHVSLCRNEAHEQAALTQFWKVLRGSQLLGFCARNFDAPTLIQRSRLLEVRHPHLNLARFGRGDVIDLRDVLTFDDARYEAIMPRSLKAFCKRFGIAVNDPIDGAQIPDLVNAGDWDEVLDHVKSDVSLTCQLANRLGYKVANEQPNLHLEQGEAVL